MVPWVLHGHACSGRRERTRERERERERERREKREREREQERKKNNTPAITRREKGELPNEAGHERNRLNDS